MKPNVSGRLKTIKKACKLLVRNILDSAFYRFGRNGSFPGRVRKVVFVCMGNICRSAFAEYFMKSISEDKQLAIESCGLDVGSSGPSPFEARITASKFGLDLDGHLSRGWESSDLESADLILAMEFRQYRKLVELFPHKKTHIKLLRDYSPFPENVLCNINDPFGCSEEYFEKCFRQIKRALISLKTKFTEGQK